MPRKYIKSRPTLRSVQEAMAIGGPMVNPPSFMNKVPRKQIVREPKPEGETPFSTRLRNEFEQLYSYWHVKLFRNNIGKWEDRSGNWITYGLKVGSSDNIGWRSIIISEDMIGKKIAVFVSAESKTSTEKISHHAQWQWLKDVHDAGGIGCEVAAKRIANWKPGEPFIIIEPKRIDDELF